MHDSHDARCLVCKSVNLVVMILSVLFTLAALYGAYRVLFVLDNRMGLSDASLAIIAAVFCLGAVKKGMKMCSCRSKGGCGCGAGCDCGGKCGCGSKDSCGCGGDHGHDHGHDHAVEMPK